MYEDMVLQWARERGYSANIAGEVAGYVSAHRYERQLSDDKVRRQALSYTGSAEVANAAVDFIRWLRRQIDIEDF